MWRLPLVAYDWPWYLFVLKRPGSKNTMESFGTLIVKMFSGANLWTNWVFASSNEHWEYHPVINFEPFDLDPICPDFMSRYHRIHNLQNPDGV